MKTNLVFLALTLPSILLATVSPFMKGRWQLNDAGCSNPGYEYSPEEKDFIEAIKDGRTVDVYEFLDASSGIYEGKLALTIHGHCEGKANFKVKYLEEGVIEIHREKLNWKFVSHGPNVTIKCDEEGPFVFRYNYRWDNSDLVFFVPDSNACGHYQYFLKRVIF